MPDLDTTIADGDPGHALLHQDANTEVNSLRGRMLSAETTITTQGTTIGQKYTKPGAGIPFADLAPAAVAAILANVVTGGATRVAAGAVHLFNDPDTVPVGPVAGDLWVGDLA